MSLYVLLGEYSAFLFSSLPLTCNRSFNEQKLSYTFALSYTWTFPWKSLEGGAGHTNSRERRRERRQSSCLWRS